MTPPLGRSQFLLLVFLFLYSYFILFCFILFCFVLFCFVFFLRGKTCKSPQVPESNSISTRTGRIQTTPLLGRSQFLPGISISLFIFYFFVLFVLRGLETCKSPQVPLSNSNGPNKDDTTAWEISVSTPGISISLFIFYFFVLVCFGFSYVGSMTGNVQIAPGSFIEFYIDSNGQRIQTTPQFVGSHSWYFYFFIFCFVFSYDP
jgi:hypothetical protein